MVIIGDHTAEAGPYGCTVRHSRVSRVDNVGDLPTDTLSVTNALTDGRCCYGCADPRKGAPAFVAMVMAFNIK